MNRVYKSVLQFSLIDSAAAGPMSPLSSGRTPRSIQAASSECVVSQLMRIMYGHLLRSHLQPRCMLGFPTLVWDAHISCMSLRVCGWPSMQRDVREQAF